MSVIAVQAAVPKLLRHVLLAALVRSSSCESDIEILQPALVLLVLSDPGADCRGDVRPGLHTAFFGIQEMLQDRQAFSQLL